MRDNKKMLSFEEVLEFLTKENTVNSVSEFHGFICGHLSGGNNTPENSLEDIQLFLDIGHIIDTSGLTRFYASILFALQDEDLAFYPLMPDDNEPLSHRLLALSTWCGGFLAGFALNNQKHVKLSALTTETLNDFAAISQINTEEDDDWDASGENDYHEVIEFLRLGVINMFLEYQKSDHLAKNGEGNSHLDLNPKKLFQSHKIH